MKFLLLCATAAFGLLAALFWAFASFQKAEFVPNERDADGLFPAVTTMLLNGRRIDLGKTAMRQTRWNAYAALMASIAAIFQAISLFIPS